MSPQVSVLVSAYNVGPFIDRCIQSILEQSFSDFELLVVDDGSTDDTLARLKGFTDPRLKVFEQENQGLTKTLNRLLGIAQGEYVARQDADDYSHPDRLQKEVEFLELNPDIALVGTWSIQVDDYNDEIYRFCPETNPAALNQILVEENPFDHGSWLARRSAIVQLGGYRNEFRCSQDYDLLLRLKEHYKLSNIPEPLYFKRHTRGMVSVQNVLHQRWFGELARRCWRERADYGIDHIQKGEFEPPPDDFSDESEVGVIAYHKHLISMLTRKGDAVGTRREIKRLLKVRGFDPFAYFQFLLSLGGGRVLKLSTDLWDSLRRE